MGILDDFGEALSDGVDALGDGAEAVVDAVDSAIDEGEEAIDDATQEFAEWFMEEVLDAGEEYLNDGGSEVDGPDTEQYESTGSRSSSLEAIDDPLVHDYGTDNETFTPPDRYTSRWSEMDQSDREADAVRLGTVDELTTESDAGPRRSPDRSEDRNSDMTSQTLDEARVDDTVSFAEVDLPDLEDGDTAIVAESIDLAGATIAADLIESMRDTDTATSQFSTVLTDSLQFVDVSNDSTGSLDEAATGRDASTTHTPEWTDFNEGDPSVTVLDGAWLDDLTLEVDDGRGSSERDGASFVETVSAPTTSNYATTLEDASPTLSMSWLF